MIEAVGKQLKTFYYVVGWLEEFGNMRMCRLPKRWGDDYSDQEKQEREADEGGNSHGKTPSGMEAG